MAFGVGSRVLTPIKAQKAWNWQSFDLGGGVILAGTLGLFLLGLTWIRQSGFSALTLGALGAAVLLALALTSWSAAIPNLCCIGNFGAVALYRGVHCGGADLCPGDGDLFSAAVFPGTDLSLHPGPNRVLVGGLKCEQCRWWPRFGGYLADRLGNLLILRTGPA